MRENDSFLKMIGLEDEDVSLDNAMPTPEAHAEELQAEDFHAEEFHSEEPLNENLMSEEVYSEEAYVEEAFSAEADTEEVYAEEVFTEEAVEEVRAEDSTERIEISKEDRLLQGIEEAEASRATDIYARSFRKDHRETRTIGLQNESDPFDDIDQTHEQEMPVGLEVEADEGDMFAPVLDQTGASFQEEHEAALNIEAEMESTDEQQESEDSRATQAFRRTQEFQYEELSGPILFCKEGLEGQKEISLSELPLTIGRDPQNKLVIDDSSISRFHAEIRYLGDQIQILDLGSTNGIKVNGAIIQAQALMNRDTIHVGDIVFEFLLSRNKLQETHHQQVVRETIVSATASMGRQKKGWLKTKKRRLIAAATFLILALSFSFRYLKDFSKDAQSLGGQIVAAQAEKAVEGFRSKIETELGRPIEDLSDEDLRKQLQAQLESTALPIPRELLQQVQNLPIAVIRFFMQEPSVLAEYLKDTSSTKAIEEALSSQIQILLSEQDLSQAESLLGALQKMNPQVPQIALLRAEIEKQKAPIVVPEPAQVADEERELFYSYMKTYQDKTDELLEANQFELAIQFIDDIKKAIIDLSRAGPQYGDLVGSALSEWDSKRKLIQRRLDEKNRQEKAIEESVLIGQRKIEEARAQLNLGKVHEAQVILDEFLEEFPNNPERENAEQLRAEIVRAIRVSFDSLKSQVETYLKTENYKVAWDSIYRFLDLVPNYDLAEELRDDVLRQTAMRASQFYNQARVFEFEADDLIAAEQYYKRVMETADPRGDLIKKAERRYAEVKRKNIQ